VVAVAWLVAAGGIAFATALTIIACRQLSIGPRDATAAGRPGVVAAAGVTLGAGAARLVWPDPSLGPLVAGILAGTACGLMFLRAFAPGVISEVAGSLRPPRVPRRSPRVPGPQPDRPRG
jgi:hypothetical protein